MPTIETVWSSLTETDIGDELLEWPPDVFALTDTVIERAGAYRFAVSPPQGAAWPPARIPGWSNAVTLVAQEWCAWAGERAEPPPEVLARGVEHARRGPDDVDRRHRLRRRVVGVRSASDAARHR